MECVPTLTNSPYVGTLQYRDAGLDKFHKKIKWSKPPYVRTIRQPLFASLLLTAVEPTTSSICVQVNPETADVAVQTEVDLSTYVINDYDGLNASKQDT